MKETDSRLTPGKKALVALSGGVDSAHAAFYLLEKGLDVAGIHFKMFSNVSEISRFLPLQKQEKNVESSLKIAEELGIDLIVKDVSEEFEREVINYFVSEYTKGRTPNPCVLCNPSIKFKHLLETAKEMNADLISTGHYSRVSFDKSKFQLLKAVDRNKDQSYYLYRLNQEILSKLFLPNGLFLKSEVVEIMKRRLRKVQFEGESQEVCFISKDYRTFLKSVVPEALKPGPIVLSDGTEVGKHEGIAFYTVGQRKGLGVSLGSKYYVVKIDAVTNTVVLGKEEDLYPKGIKLSQVHFISGPYADSEFECRIKVRYRSREVKCVVNLKGESAAEVYFKEKCAFPAPGQSAVFYKDEVVLGGGIIEEWL